SSAYRGEPGSAHVQRMTASKIDDSREENTKHGRTSRRTFETRAKRSGWTSALDHLRRAAAAVPAGADRDPDLVDLEGVGRSYTGAIAGPRYPHESPRLTEVGRGLVLSAPTARFARCLRGE